MYSDMTAAAFRAALARLELSYSQAKTFLEVSNIRLVRDWASGRKRIPDWVAASFKVDGVAVFVRGSVSKMLTRDCSAAEFLPLMPRSTETAKILKTSHFRPYSIAESARRIGASSDAP
jgi:hypothetical protein